MHLFKKAQAAMEFLMTYGWAILVVLVVIGALSYFGVLSPATLLPEKCTFPVSVSCIDHQVTPTQLSLVIQNGAGRDMIVRDISASSDALGDSSGGQGCALTTTDVNLRNSQRSTFVMDNAEAAGPPTSCTFTDRGRDKNRYNITIFYSWLDSPTIEHRLNGELLGKGP